MLRASLAPGEWWNYGAAPGFCLNPSLPKSVVSRAPCQCHRVANPRITELRLEKSSNSDPALNCACPCTEGTIQSLYQHL